ncbi:universal stress protein [Streptomyces sp. NBC_01763]|uniref:universal stress protein n=1 Tax=Streptomyces sp. NBC_01763 TaxID=2975934 RepID=UPI002DD99136|nr:universal stress protein [Streptomyces sp. NBC_01763]WSC35596.1 universal stress protein [Streptomyces sp. NBC_01763]
MTGDQRLIVVGVDGSEVSKEALRWAARHAELTGAVLRVVTAWRLPPTYGYLPDYSDVDFAAGARETLDSAINAVLGPTPQLSVDARVEEGPPAPVLLAAAREADLLVVGSRGHGAFAEMLLGSTAQHCVHHAPCPVLVVRPQTT